MYSTFISMKTIENLAASKPPPNEANVLHSDLAKPTASPSSTSNISRFYPELLLPHTLALTKTLCAMSNLDILGHTSPTPTQVSPAAKTTKQSLCGIMTIEQACPSQHAVYVCHPEQHKPMTHGLWIVDPKR
jgi:hypothetical protein